MKSIHLQAKKQILAPSEYPAHNRRRALDILFFAIAHVLLSFLIILVPWWAGILLGLLSGYFAYCYFVITVHESAHDLLFISAHKKRMRTIRRLIPAINMLMGFPAYNVYLRDHKLHHAYLSTPKDAQNTAHAGFADLPAFYFKRELQGGHPPITLSLIFKDTNLVAYAMAVLVKLAHVIAVIALGGVSAFFIGIVWPLVFATILNLFRISIEHYNLFPAPKLLRSRTYTFTGAGLPGPGGLKYHFEHHLCERVPSYRLRKIHAFAKKELPQDVQDRIFYNRFKLRDFL